MLYISDVRSTGAMWKHDRIEEGGNSIIMQYLSNKDEKIKNKWTDTHRDKKKDRGIDYLLPLVLIVFPYIIQAAPHPAAWVGRFPRQWSQQSNACVDIILLYGTVPVHVLQAYRYSTARKLCLLLTAGMKRFIQHRTFWKNKNKYKSKQCTTAVMKPFNFFSKWKRKSLED
jgi:hypothetical protein